MSEYGFISLNKQVYTQVYKLEGGVPDKVHLPQAVGKIRQDTEVSPAYLCQQCRLMASTDAELVGNTNDS